MNCGADGDALVEIRDVGVEHADAAVRDEAADRARRIGAVDGILTVRKRQRGYAHWISRRTAGDDAGN